MNPTGTAPTVETSGSAQLLNRGRTVEVARIVVVGALVLAYSQDWVPQAVLWGAVALGLYPLLRTGFTDLIEEHKVGTELFVSAATLIAVFGGEEVAGAVLMVIILFAEFIADFNTERTRASIRNLVGSVPQTATIRTDGGDRQVSVTELEAGDVVLVRAGEMVPVDGTVIEGRGSANEATITGESIPVDKAAGASAFAGTVLESGAIDVRADRVGDDTTFARIVAMVEDAESTKAPVERLADRVAGFLVPVMIVFLIVVFLVTRDVRKVVTLMVFTSPAELALATPIVIVASIARSARSGILLKGGLPLETLAKADTVVFDKTGTLTVGDPEVNDVVVIDRQFDAATLLSYAAAVERLSSHPIAEAIVREAERLGAQRRQPTDFVTTEGRGVSATVDGAVVALGNAAMLTDAGIVEPSAEGSEGVTRIFVLIDRRLVGTITVADAIRPTAAQAVQRLRDVGVRQVVMLTGDARPVAERVAASVGIDRVEAELLPNRKVDAIRRLQSKGARVAMVGDGVNDAPALAVADVGIAMGAAGTKAALEAADIALMTDDLMRIATARAIARRAYRTIKENLFLGVGVVHVLGIAASLAGVINPVQAAFIHLGPDIAVFVNSTKLLRVKIES